MLCSYCGKERNCFFVFNLKGKDRFCCAKRCVWKLLIQEKAITRRTILEAKQDMRINYAHVTIATRN